MNAVEYWNLFMETGAPEAYLLYHASQRTEESYVSYGQSSGTSGIRVQ
jgi:hypothetical protein